MPSLYQLKPAFQARLQPIMHFLARHGVTANQVTVAAVLLSLAGGLLIACQPTARWPLLLLPVVLLLRMALNALDGMLARAYDQQSALGTLLNEMGDVVADAALYLPLALVPGISPLWVVLVVLLATFSEMVGVVALQIGAPRQYQGPMGKSDRAFWLGALALLMGLGLQAGAWQDSWLIALSLGLVMTIYHRARGALKAAHAD